MPPLEETGMIRSATHSSYPAAPDAEDDGAALDIGVAEQSRAFVDVVGDGQVRWTGPLSRLASRLEGAELSAEDAAWPDARVRDRRPVIAGELRRRGAFAVADWAAASRVTPKPVKVAMPGPVTFARLADDRHYRDVARAAGAVAEALAEEVAALHEAGCRWFQLDEPLLVARPEDAPLVADACGRVFRAAGPGSVTILSTFFGALPLDAAAIAALPGTHLGLDATEPEGLDVLARVPDGRGLALGLFDARLEEAEDAADVAARLAPFRERLAGRDVLVGPNAGLAPLTRDAAFDKLLQARYLAETLRRTWR
jgi:5-methyltetrahydropteroyltriglutamate--homocysteine methyltransferase